MALNDNTKQESQSPKPEERRSDDELISKKNDNNQEKAVIKVFIRSGKYENLYVIPFLDIDVLISLSL